MTWTHIQGGSNSGANNAATVTVTAVGTNNLVAGFAQCDTFPNTGSNPPIGDWSITNNGTSTYTVVDNISDTAGNNTFGSLYTAAGTGETTITATNSAGSTNGAMILVDEFSGNNSIAALDGHAIAITTSSGSGVTLSSGNASPATNGDLIY